MKTFLKILCSYIASCTVLFCILWKVLKPLGFTLSVRGLSRVFVHFEEEMVLSTASVQNPSSGV